MLLLLSVFHIAFMVYFVYIGLRWMAFLPLIGIATIFFSQGERLSKQQMSKQQITQLFSRYAFAIARCFVLLGVWGIADIYLFASEYVGLWLVGGNLFLWIGSYLFDYDEGKQMFHVGYYVASLITFWSISSFFSAAGLLELFMLWVAMTMAVYAFIVFVIGIVTKHVDRAMSYPLFIYIHLCAMYLIYHYVNADVYLALVLAQVYLMVVYTIIYLIQRVRPDSEETAGVDDKLLRRILSGKSVNRGKSPMKRANVDLFLEAHSFLRHLQPSVKFIISLFNVLLIAGQIYYFLGGFDDYTLVWREAILRFGIIAFFVNYLLLKAIDFYFDLQRVVAFILINFGIYISIFNIFGYDVIYLMSFGIAWSIINSIAIFHAKYLATKGIFDRADFLYWIGANVLATLVNLYFIFLLPVSLQLKFSLGAVYFGIQFFLLLYNLRYVQATIRS